MQLRNQLGLDLAAPDPPESMMYWLSSSSREPHHPRLCVQFTGALPAGRQARRPKVGLLYREIRIAQHGWAGSTGESIWHVCDHKKNKRLHDLHQDIDIRPAAVKISDGARISGALESVSSGLHFAGGVRIR